MAPERTWGGGKWWKPYSNNVFIFCIWAPLRSDLRIEWSDLGGGGIGKKIYIEHGFLEMRSQWGLFDPKGHSLNDYTCNTYLNEDIFLDFKGYEDNSPISLLTPSPLPLPNAFFLFTIH